MVASPGVLIIVLLFSILTHFATMATDYVQIAQVVSLIFSSDAARFGCFHCLTPFSFYHFFFVQFVALMYYVLLCVLVL